MLFIMVHKIYFSFTKPSLVDFSFGNNFLINFKSINLNSTI